MIARMPERPVVLEMQHITKRFPGIVANDDVELRPPRGRGPRAARRERRRQVDADEHPLRALPPGRGRDPDQGQAGAARLAARGDRRGRRHGAPALHADPGDDGRREHRARARSPTTPACCSTSHAAEQRVARARRERFGSRSTPTRAIEDITVGQQQRVEILKALYRNADILVLDEPTAVLTPQEARGAVRDPARPHRAGDVVIFITHKLNEVLEIADRITVLRRGKLVETLPAEGATEESLARLMVGRDVLLRVDKTAGQAGRDAARGRGPAASSTTAGSRRCAASRSRCARARSSASPASTATARPS